MCWREKIFQGGVRLFFFQGKGAVSWGPGGTNGPTTPQTRPQPNLGRFFCQGTGQENCLAPGRGAKEVSKNSQKKKQKKNMIDLSGGGTWEEEEWECPPKKKSGGPQIRRENRVKKCLGRPGRVLGKKFQPKKTGISLRRLGPPKKKGGGGENPKNQKPADGRDKKTRLIWGNKMLINSKEGPHRKVFLFFVSKGQGGGHQGAGQTSLFPPRRPGNTFREFFSTMVGEQLGGGKGIPAGGGKEKKRGGAVWTRGKKNETGGEKKRGGGEKKKKKQTGPKKIKQTGGGEKNREKKNKKKKNKNIFSFGGKTVGGDRTFFWEHFSVLLFSKTFRRIPEKFLGGGGTTPFPGGNVFLKKLGGEFGLPKTKKTKRGLFYPKKKKGKNSVG